MRSSSDGATWVEQAAGAERAAAVSGAPAYGASATGRPGRPVVVGVDGSAESLVAAEWAGAEAVSRDVPLWIVCARKPTGADEWEAWPQRQLHAAHRLATGLYPSLQITEVSVCDVPAQALLTASEEADVLVIGSRDLGPTEGFGLGAVALPVIADARRPVVAVRGRMPAGAAAETGPVVAGVDPHENSDAVLDFAFRTAAAQGRTLRVAHAQADLQAERELGELLQPWRERFPEVDTEIRTKDEAVAPYLLQVSSDAALLAVGHRIGGDPFPTRMGPVVHALLHHSRRPVAVVPHE